MKTRQAKVAFDSHTSFQILYICYYETAWCISNLHASCKRRMQCVSQLISEYTSQFSYICSLNCIGVQAQGPRYTKLRIIFICTFSFECFTKFCAFHNAWVDTASMSLFSTNACLLKPVGIDVQTSNSHTREVYYVFTQIFTILRGYFQKLYCDFACFM